MAPVSGIRSGGGGAGEPDIHYNGLYEEALPKRGILFRVELGGIKG